MQPKRGIALVVAIGALALLAAVPAIASAPTTSTSDLHISDVDTDSCAFAINLTVDRSRTTTTFSNGDITRHVDLTVDQRANGHDLLETDRWNVFIPADDPTDWKLTGRFTQVWLDGRLISVQSGFLGFDAETGEVTDPHPGPLGAYPDACAALAA